MELLWNVDLTIRNNKQNAPFFATWIKKNIDRDGMTMLNKIYNSNEWETLNKKEEIIIKLK